MKSFVKSALVVTMLAVVVVSFGCDKMKKQDQPAEATVAPQDQQPTAAPAAAPAAAEQPAKAAQ